MFKKRPDSGKAGFNLLKILLHPCAKILGGIFSILAAVFFGKFQLSRRKKKKATEAEVRAASSVLLTKLQDIRSQLKKFQVSLKKQEEQKQDIREIQQCYAGLKNLYNEWTSHERMEEVLGTVQYDPKIGINVSNGLHELRSLNILIETVLRDDLLGSAIGTKQMTTVDEHLNRAIAFFDYTGKNVEKKS